jgi:hypothetical protein
LSGCTGCGRALYFSERVHLPQEFCRPCASARGIDRLCDRAFKRHMEKRASLLKPWWRWAVWLEHALRWTEHDEAGRRDACTVPM